MKAIQKYLTDTQESVSSNYLNEKGFSVCGYSLSYVVVIVPILCYFHEIDTKISN